MTAERHHEPRAAAVDLRLECEATTSRATMVAGLQRYSSDLLPRATAVQLPIANAAATARPTQAAVVMAGISSSPDPVECAVMPGRSAVAVIVACARSLLAATDARPVATKTRDAGSTTTIAGGSPGTATGGSSRARTGCGAPTTISGSRRRTPRRSPMTCAPAATTTWAMSMWRAPTCTRRSSSRTLSATNR